MIKFLGVIGNDGIPVYCKILSPGAQKEKLSKAIMPALISIIEHLSEMVGKKEEKVKQFTFGNDRLLVITTKKNLVVAALTTAAEDYVKSLLEVIADEINESESIEYQGGIVTPELSSRIQKILDMLITNEIEVNLEEVISNIWNPTLNACKSHTKLTSIIEQVRKLKEKLRTEELISWKRFEESITGSIDDAINYALAGDFSHACAIALKFDDDLAKIFGIKMGLLAHSMAFSVSPLIEILEQLLYTVKNKNKYVELLELEIKLLKNEISMVDYIKKFQEVANEFKFENTRESIMYSFVFLNVTGLRFSQDFTKKLADYFRDKSEVIHTFLTSIIEREELLRKIYSITRYDEVKDKIAYYRAEIPTVINELERIVKAGLLKRLFGFAPRGPEANRILLRCSMLLETALILFTVLLQSPIFDLLQKKEIVEEIIDIYFKYIRSIINRKLPIPRRSLLNYFQIVGITLDTYYHMLTKPERNKLLRKAIDILTDMRKVVEEEINKVNHQIYILGSSLASINMLLARNNIFNENAFFVTYVVMDQVDVEKAAAWKTIFPYNYVALIANTCNATTPLAYHLLDAETRVKVLEKAVEYNIKSVKWLLSQAKMTREPVIFLTWYLKNIADKLPDEKFASYMKIVLALARIAVPDPTRYDHDLALIAESLIDFLIIGGSKLKNDKYIALAKSLAETAEKIWRKYGFNRKADEIALLKEKIFSQTSK